MDEILLLESPSLRQRLCNPQNLALLDKAGTLETLSQTNCASLKQVAHFYLVSEQAIKNLVFDHKAELLSDGYKIFKKKDLEKFLKETFDIPNRGLALFPRQAVLRIGMLLRDSLVAQQIRSYLLKVEEHFWGNVQVQENLHGFSRQLMHQAQALVEHADQLTSHSNQLASQASQLQNHSEQVTKQANQLAAQARIIAALAEEMYFNRSEIQEIKSEMKTYEKRLHILETTSTVLFPYKTERLNEKRPSQKTQQTSKNQKNKKI